MSASIALAIALIAPIASAGAPTAASAKPAAAPAQIRVPIDQARPINPAPITATLVMRRFLPCPVPGRRIPPDPTPGQTGLDAGARDG
jgi:hypothetical protein